MALKTIRIIVAEERTPSVKKFLENYACHAQVHKENKVIDIYYNDPTRPSVLTRVAVLRYRTQDDAFVKDLGVPGLLLYALNHRDRIEPA